MTHLVGKFNDALTFNSDSKTAISLRDGVLIYLGAELGLEPADREFTVYRSPATIANAAQKMQGLPLTDEHVHPDGEVEQPVGSVESSELTDLFDDDCHSTVGVKNRITVGDVMTGALETGKRQLSLGYGADLVPHTKYDFEQRDILPHHLAVVTAGRCGPSCAFIDHKPTEGDPMPKPSTNKPEADQLNTLFVDAEGNPNLEQIVEIASALPMALRKLPVDELQKVLPTLQEIVTLASSQGGETAEPAESEQEVEDETPAEAEQMQDESEDEKPSYEDSAKFKDAVALAVANASEQLTAVIDKAVGFLDQGYEFKGKTSAQIMRDALAVEHGDQSFTDEELPVAFKLLKKTDGSLNKFGDGAPTGDAGRFSKAADKDLN